MTGLPEHIELVTRSVGQAQAFYDRLSRFYDLLSGASERRYVGIGLGMLAVRPGEHLLEIGSGTGHALVALARQAGPDGRVYGLDLSLGMSAVARARLLRAGLERSVSLVCGDALHLPICSAALDGMLMSFTLELFDTPDIPGVLAECRRVLRPAGRLAVVALSKPAHPSFSVAVYEWFHRRFPQLVDCRPIPVRHFLAQAGFIVLQAQQFRMLGLLPLEIALVANGENH